MTNPFAFLHVEWPAVYEAADKAAAAVYPDPRTDSFAEMDALFASLQHRAFRGELRP